MKTRITILILIIIILSGFYFRNEILNLYSKLTETLHQIEKISEPLINKIETKVSAPPPLRAPEEAPESFLTKSGTIRITNLQRTNNGLPALKENTKLNAAALAKAKDMFANQYFEHTSPSGAGPADLAQKAGYDFILIGENLAMGNFADDKALVQGWMDSPGHRANILNYKFSEIGVAVVKGKFEGKETWMAVQEFGFPLSSCPAPEETIRNQVDDYRKQLEDLSVIINNKKTEIENTVFDSREKYKIAVEQYNQLVAQYNDIVGQIKSLAGIYNSQIDAFNQCVSQ